MLPSPAHYCLLDLVLGGKRKKTIDIDVDKIFAELEAAEQDEQEQNPKLTKEQRIADAKTAAKKDGVDLDDDLLREMDELNQELADDTDTQKNDKTGR